MRHVDHELHHMTHHVGPFERFPQVEVLQSHATSQHLHDVIRFNNELMVIKTREGCGKRICEGDGAGEEANLRKVQTGECERGNVES